MSIDVIDLAWANPRIGKRVEHDTMSAITIVGRKSNVKCITAHAVSHEFGDDLSAAFLR